MTGSRKNVFLFVGMAAGLASAAYLLAPKAGPGVSQLGASAKHKAEVKADGMQSNGRAADDYEDFIKKPPQSRVLKRSSTTEDRTRVSTLKLESWLSPTDLQVYYTDMLVKDWMIAKDDLTEGIGWSGVFMQMEPEEKSMGIFVVVEKIGPPSGRANPTIISIMKIEAL